MHEFITVPIKFNPELLTDFERSFNAALKNKQVNVIVLGGGPHYFCLGMDLDYIATGYDPHFVTQFCNILRRVRASSKPVLAQVKGEVIAGGIALLSIADFIISDEAASFRLPESSFGLTPGIAMACLLERLTPHHIKYLAWSAEALSAKQALEWGLIDKVSSVGRLEQDVLAVSHKLSRTPGSVIAESRQLLGKHSSFEKTLHLGEQLLQGKLKDPLMIEKTCRYLENIRLFNDLYAGD